MRHDPPADVVEKAIKAARTSPCAKSKRGVVLFDDVGPISVAHNAPPAGFTCDGSDACRAACGRVAVHAEQRAILLGAERPYSLDVASALHMKVVDGELVAGGGPSCVDCSKLILAAGIAYVWLYEAHPAGPKWVRYDAVEFHRLSLVANGLPVIQATP